MIPRVARTPGLGHTDGVTGPRSAVVVNPAKAPADLRAAVDPWGPLTAEPLMRRVKARFDPHDVLNPGLLLT